MYSIQWNLNVMKCQASIKIVFYILGVYHSGGPVQTLVTVVSLVRQKNVVVPRISLGLLGFISFSGFHRALYNKVASLGIKYPK